MDWSLIARGGEKWAKEGMACVKAANEVRTQHWALTRGTARVIQADHENGIIVVERHYEGVEEDGKTKMNQRLIVVVNDGDGQWDAEGTYGINVGPPWGEDGGAFEEIFNSQDEDFGGWPLSPGLVVAGGSEASIDSSSALSSTASGLVGSRSSRLAMDSSWPAF